MKKLVLIIFTLFTASIFAQVIQRNAPWVSQTNLKVKQNITLEETKVAALNYFSSIDKDKKGSGLKPFERWNYHWSHYTKSDGTIAPASDLWGAWKKKNEMSASASTARTDDSNWNSLGPYSHTNTGSYSPGQGRVNAIAVDPSNSETYYVGAPAGGIWKSTDAGSTWSPLTDYLPQIGVSGIAVHPTNPQIIYIATGDDDAGDSYSVGVWKTIDGGESWNNTGSLAGNPNSMNDIFIHPSQTETIMVATSSGVHKSSNGGDLWNRNLSGNIRDLKMRPNDPSIWYAASNNSFYKSTDSGETFQQTSITALFGSQRIVMDVTPNDPDYVYFVSSGSGGSFNGVWKSTDSGDSFTETAESDDIFESTQSWYDLALTVSDKDADKVYVGVLNIWSSTDGGDNFTKLNNWSSPNTDSYTHADIHILKFIDGKFFAGTDGGIYVSTNHGTNFTDLTENLAISQFYKISVAQQNSGNIVGGLQDNGGFAFSDNNWNVFHGADGMDGAVSGSDPNTYYNFIQNGGRIYITNNAGLSSSSSVEKPDGESGRWVTPLVSDSQGNIYAGYNELHKLVDGAWTQVSTHNFGGSLYHIEIDPNDDNNIYVSLSGGLYRSTDAGVTFEKIADFFGETINSIEINNNDSTIAYVTTNGNVKKSINILSSANFTDITSNLPGESKLVARHHARSGNNTIYVGTALGVYSLNDDSTSWEVFSNNLPNVAVRDLEINEEDSKLFAATYGRGVFKTDIPRTLPPKDLRLLEINNPTGITCSTTFVPEILVLNQGTDQITEIDIAYTIDGVLSNYQWTGTIESEQTQAIQIPAVTIETGNHEIAIEAVTTDDAYDTNNEKEASFIVNNTNNDPTNLNSFENADADSFLIDTQGTEEDLWELARPGGALLNATSTGENVYVTNKSGEYTNLTTSYLFSKCINLSLISAPVLSFKMAFDIEENWDYMNVEYSTTGESWTILGSASDPNWYNSASTENSIPGAQWTGLGEDTHSDGNTNATIREYSYDLSSLTEESNIVFRFKFFTDQAVVEEGALIDDWVVNGTALSLNDEELQSSFNVYPNPSSEIFNLTWSENGDATVIVYDYTGRLVMKKENLKENKYELNLNGFSRGLYITKINVNGKQATKKLILE